MKRKFILGVLAYLIPTFALGYFWHLVAFHDDYERLEIYRSDIIIPFGVLSMLVQGLFFSWSYPRLFSTARSAWVPGALKSALVFAALSWSFTTLAVAAKNKMASVADYAMIESAFTAVQFLLVAPLLALVHRERS